MSAFLATEDYPQLKILETNFVIIASEIPNFKFSEYKRNREAWNNSDMDAMYDDLKNNDKWIQSWQEGWYNFPLIYNNKVVGKAKKLCPRTIKILKKIDIKIAGFSLLKAKSEINAHTDLTGPSYNSMACNMLLTNNISKLYLAQKNEIHVYQHVMGEAVIFNSENMHFVTNESSTDRIILYLDFNT